MTTFEKLYNRTNLEKEIKEFYTKVEEDSVGYIKDTLHDKIDMANLVVDANSIKIENTGHEALTELGKTLYKIPGKVIMDQNTATIMM